VGTGMATDKANGDLRSSARLWKAARVTATTRDDGLDTQRNHRVGESRTKKAWNISSEPDMSADMEWRYCGCRYKRSRETCVAHPGNQQSRQCRGTEQKIRQ